MRIRIDESCDSFRMLRENKSYYVDKTIMLKEFLEDSAKSRVLFARSRRFGKTMTMTMFRDFLDVRQDSRDIFDGLKIMNYQDTVAGYMNKYPVIFLSLKEVFGDSFDSVFKFLQINVSIACKGYIHILQSDKVNTDDKEQLEKIIRREGSLEDTIGVLDLLSRILNDHYGKSVFVIIDEYDVPMAKALGTPYYEKVRDMVEHMLSYVCKTNDNVKAVMLSGCLYTVKNSTYTGVNNIVPYTVLSPNFASCIGFTDDDVKKLLEDAGIPDRYETVEEWYDGYLFGREKMYCPWDVLRYVSSVLDGSYSEAMEPESYWVNTSETSLNTVRGFIGKISGINESFEQLMAGKTIDCVVNENLNYHLIHENSDNIWSALLETGYLTKAVPDRMIPVPLRITNKSIRVVFRQEIWYFFKSKVNNAFVADLKNALW